MPSTARAPPPVLPDPRRRAGLDAPLSISAAVIRRPLGPRARPLRPALAVGGDKSAGARGYRKDEGVLVRRGCGSGAALSRRLLPDMRAAEGHPAVPPAAGAAAGSGRLPWAPHALAARTRSGGAAGRGWALREEVTHGGDV